MFSTSYATAAFPRFAELMTKFSYDNWTAHEVETSDGYLLTTFNIPANPSVPAKGSILIQHGDMQDGASWIENFGDEKSFHLLLVDQGYNVWIGNNRGTEYSQRHKLYEATAASGTAEEFWDFTWADMQYDDKANIQAIKKVTGEEKITYLGYSQGTIQMHYALAHDDEHWFKQNLHKIVQLAPCFVVENVPGWFQNEYNSTLATFRDHEIYAINGPNWEEDLDKICDLFDMVICDYYWYGRDESQPVSVKSEQYWIQNGILNEFNEWQEDWLSGDHSSAPIDVSTISDVPMSFLVGNWDVVCPADVARSYIEQMQTQTHIVEVSLEGHFYFADEANTEWFMGKLLEELVY